MNLQEFSVTHEIPEWLLKEVLNLPLKECHAKTVYEAEAICESIIKTYKKDPQEENFEYEDDEEYRAAFKKWLDLCSTPQEAQIAYLSACFGGESYARSSYQKWDELALKLAEETNDFREMVKLFYSGIPKEGESGRLLMKKMYLYLSQSKEKGEIND